MCFLLFAAFTLYLSSHAFDSPTLQDTGLYGQADVRGVGLVLMLFVSVLLHEVGHAVIARRLGGKVDEIVIGPVGGLTAVHVPYEPQSELVALMAGTLVNAAICLAAAFSLAVGPDSVELFKMLNPLTLGSLQAGEASSISGALKVVFWINWMLILVNLIPAFPFDGGYSLRALLSMLWPELDARQSRITICRVGMVISVVLLLLASYSMLQSSVQINLNEPRPLDPQLTWFALMLLSIYIFFIARREGLQPSEQEEHEDTVFGYDFSQGYTSLERSSRKPHRAGEHVEGVVPPANIIGRWLEKRRAVHRQREIAQEIEDERRVDEILSRLHERGMRSLSPEDRALLDRVSKRYRSRQG